MLKQGFKENTITMKMKLLEYISRQASLYDPESVKEAIAKMKWSDNTKRNAVNAYSTFLKMVKGTWEPPHYKETQTIPFIPLEAEIDALISGCGKKTATALQCIKETAARVGEVVKIKWVDVDTEQKTIRINNPLKGSNPRICKVSDRLLSMINNLPRKNENVFNSTNVVHMRKNFTKQRKRIAEKLKNPRLLQIHFHTIRHWKATMEAHRTRDPFYVQEILGHTNIKNTMRYIHLAQIIFKEVNDQFTCRVAKTREEAVGLIEAGFDFVHEFNGEMYFRKRK